MAALDRKLLRDITAEKGRFIAVTALVFLGLAAFFTCWMAYRNLDVSYQRNNELLAFNDFVIQTAGTPDTVARELAAIPGVSVVLPRLSLRSGITLPSGAEVDGRLVGLPGGTQPPVNDVFIQQGDYLGTWAGGADAPGCLVEQHLADYYGIVPGDVVEVLTPHGRAALEVAGIVASSEFFLVMGEGSEFLASPRNYGVLFVSQPWLQEAFDSEGISNQFCFLMNGTGGTAQERAAATVEARAAAEGVLGPYNIEYSRLRDEMPVRKMLDTDVRNMRQMSFVFPFFFLIIAALGIFTIITRLVHNERQQMGTMMALGYGRGRLARHYLLYPLMVGIAGSVAGIVAGYFLASAITGLYAETMGVPRLFTTMDWRAAALGVGLAMVICLLAGLLPVWRLVKQYPARVMRVDGDGGGGRRHRRSGKEMPTGRRRVPVSWSMPFHNITRDFRRSFFNLLGVVFSIMLILVALGALDWINSILDFQYGQMIRYDADVSFTGPAGQEQVDALSRVTGVTRVEPYAMVPCRFSNGGEVIGEGMVEVIPSDCELLGLYDLKGRRIGLPEEGELFSNWFQQGLKVGTGEGVTAETPLGSMEMTADGFFKQLGGLTIFVNRDVLAGTPLDGVYTGAMVSSDGRDLEALREGLLGVEGVASVTLPEYVMEMMQTMVLGMIYLFIGFLIAFAVAMAVALIYNTMTIAFMEREREVTLMLALGYSVRKVAALFAAENLLVAVAAILPGLVLGHYALVFMVTSMANEFIALPGVTSWSSYLIAGLCVIPVVLLAQLPSLWRVRRVDLTRAIKDRSL
jgi:putative ABC transport system permease protein